MASEESDAGTPATSGRRRGKRERKRHRPFHRGGVQARQADADLPRALALAEEAAASGDLAELERVSRPWDWSGAGDRAHGQLDSNCRNLI